MFKRNIFSLIILVIMHPHTLNCRDHLIPRIYFYLISHVSWARCVFGWCLAHIRCTLIYDGIRRKWRAWKHIKIIFLITIIIFENESERKHQTDEFLEKRTLEFYTAMARGFWWAEARDFICVHNDFKACVCVCVCGKGIFSLNMLSSILPVPRENCSE